MLRIKKRPPYKVLVAAFAVVVLSGFGTHIALQAFMDTNSDPSSSQAREIDTETGTLIVEDEKDKKSNKKNIPTSNDPAVAGSRDGTSSAPIQGGWTSDGSTSTSGGGDTQASQPTGGSGGGGSIDTGGSGGGTDTGGDTGGDGGSNDEDKDDTTLPLCEALVGILPNPGINCRII